VFQVDDRLVGVEAGALGQIAQLADIAFETAMQQVFERRRRQLAPQSAIDALEQRSRQKRNVLGPFGERRRVQRKNVDAVISSRNSVPPLAASMSPSLRWVAPVNAPFS